MSTSIQKKIINLQINVIGFKELINKISKTGGQILGHYVCFANVHMCIEAYKNEKVRNAVNNSSYTVTDGMPLVVSLRLLYGLKQERIPGMDFMPDLMKTAELRNESVFFYGSTERILNEIEKRSIKDFPGLRIVGKISPPFSPVTQEELDLHVKKINESGAKYVFIGLGCPKQELWMAENSNKINAVLLGVGGAFEVYAGIKKKAPEWMRKWSLEWIFRLIQEPGRLFKRYLLTNSIFLYLFIIQFIRYKVFSGN